MTLFAEQVGGGEGYDAAVTVAADCVWANRLNLLDCAYGFLRGTLEGEKGRVMPGVDRADDGERKLTGQMAGQSAEVETFVTVAGDAEDRASARLFAHREDLDDAGG